MLYVLLGGRNSQDLLSDGDFAGERGELAHGYAGCGDGRLYMFNWGEFGLHNADFPGHPDAINHLVSHNIFQPVQLNLFIAKAL